VSVRSQTTLSALPEAVQAPSNNPTDAAKVTLGRLLFWDPILSGGKDVACATCHHPRFGYAENLDLSIGVNGVGLGEGRRFETPNSVPFVKRNSQTILNVGFNGIDPAGRYSPSAAPMFWDTRVESLEKQALEPIKSFEEMRGDAYPEEKALDIVVARLEATPEYRSLFSKAFGGSESISAGNLGKALAAFQRSLIAVNSPFDRYMRGEANAMTPEQVRGMARFERAGCANCHSGPMFSDYKVHVLGVADNPKLPATDTGVSHTYGFRTASLRNLAYTAPYMHSGVLRTLNDVLSFYNGGRGGGRRNSRNPNVGRDALDPLLRRLNVGGRRSEIVQFLNALNDDGFDRTVPDEVPSGLPPGGKIQ
jgi:cytochrome c peroxidase